MYFIMVLTKVKLIHLHAKVLLSTNEAEGLVLHVGPNLFLILFLIASRSNLSTPVIQKSCDLPAIGLILHGISQFFLCFHAESSLLPPLSSMFEVTSSDSFFLAPTLNLLLWKLYICYIYLRHFFYHHPPLYWLGIYRQLYITHIYLHILEAYFFSSFIWPSKTCWKYKNFCLCKKRLNAGSPNSSFS